jgi:hypothetical protein
MRKIHSEFSIRSALAVGLSLFMALSSSASQVTNTASALQLVVMEGEGATFDLRHPAPIDLVVQVRDPQGNPRRQAIVVFILPGVGASGFFAGGARTLMVNTDDNGIATARVLRPNGTTGDFTVRVTAQFEAARAATEIHLHNVSIGGGENHAARWVSIGAIAAGVTIGILFGTGVLQSDPNKTVPPTTVTFCPPGSPQPCPGTK